MLDWPNWIVLPVLAFYAVPFWVRIAVGVALVAAIGRWLL